MLKWGTGERTTYIYFVKNKMNKKYLPSTIISRSATAKLNKYKFIVVRM